MVGSDAHGGSVFFADPDQGRESFADTIDLFRVFGIGVFDLFKFLFVNIVARVHADFLNDTGCDLRRIGREMYIRNDGRSITAFAEFVFYVQQVLCFFLGGSGDADQFGTGFYATNTLFHRGDRIHCIGGGHRLYPNGMTVPQPEITDADG